MTDADMLAQVARLDGLRLAVVAASLRAERLRSSTEAEDDERAAEVRYGKSLALLAPGLLARLRVLLTENERVRLTAAGRSEPNAGERDSAHMRQLVRDFGVG